MALFTFMMIAHVQRAGAVGGAHARPHRRAARAGRGAGRRAARVAAGDPREHRRRRDRHRQRRAGALPQRRRAAAHRLARRRGRRPAGGRAAVALRRARRQRPSRARCTTALRRRTAAAAGGEPALRARDGSVHPVDVNAAPIIDSASGLAGAVLVLREAAVQRQAERAMREAYTELDQSVVQQDRGARARERRPAGEERAAECHHHQHARPDLRQGPPGTHPDGQSGVDARRSGKVEHDVVALDEKERLVLDSGETMIIEESVEQRTYLTTKSPLRDEQSRIIGLIGVATDITERKRGAARAGEAGGGRAAAARRGRARQPRQGRVPRHRVARAALAAQRAARLEPPARHHAAAGGGRWSSAPPRRSSATSTTRRASSTICSTPRAS